MKVLTRGHFSSRDMIAAALLYIREFRRKGLTRLHPCRRYYARLTAKQLLAESEWVFGPPTEPLPFPFIFLRSYALFDALIERAAFAHAFSAAERRALSHASEKGRQAMLRRVAPSERERLLQLLRGSARRMRHGTHVGSVGAVSLRLH